MTTTDAERDTREPLSARVHKTTKAALKDAAAGDDEHRGHTTLAGDLIEAALDFARCHRCSQQVPVLYGNLAGKPFRKWADEARWTATRQHPDHQPVLVGAASPVAAESAPAETVAQLQQDIPGLVPASELPPAGSAVFQAPGGSLVVAAAAPAATAGKRRKKARCAHVVAAGTRCKICEPR